MRCCCMRLEAYLSPDNHTVRDKDAFLVKPRFFKLKWWTRKDNFRVSLVDTI